MSTRKLTRVGLSNQWMTKLGKHQMVTVKDLYKYHPSDLVHMLDADLSQITSMLEMVAEKIVPTPKTAYELLHQSKTGKHILSLNPTIPNLQIMKGITELVGPAGVGKTQCCLTLCVMASLPEQQGGLGGGVIYIDTESTFHPARLVELAQTRYPEVYQSTELLRELAMNVIVYNPNTSTKLEEKLNQLEQEIIERNIKLIIVDSIAAPIRHEFSYEQTNERQQLLSNVASKLKYLSETFSIPCVVTNQVTTRVDATSSSTDSTPSLIAALGVSWTHSVNTRLLLQSDMYGRLICIGKSPMFPKCTYRYEVTSGGIIVNPNETEETTSGNVLEMRILGGGSAIDGPIG